MLGDVRLLAVLPSLPLSSAQTEGNDDGPSLSAQPGEDLVGVELPVEVETADLDAGLLGVVEYVSKRMEQSPSVVEVVGGDREAEPVMDDVEGDIPIGAVRASLLLRFHELRMSRVDRLAVVRCLVEVDRDIYRVGRDVGTSLFTKGQREGALGLPSNEVFENALSMPFGRAAPGVGASPSDRGVAARGPEDQVGHSAEKGRGEPSLREAGREEGEKPRECPATRFAIGQEARRPSPPPQG